MLLTKPQPIEYPYITILHNTEMREAPFWFSKTALTLLLTIFISCAASLIAVDRVIASRNGLALSISSNPYSWTYGPTAILIVILSLWRRLDYYFKLREPWRELLAGPCPAKKSILLDYITPFQIVSLVRSMKNRHYNVAATITGFFLLKLIILGSTALFVVENTEIRTTVNVTFTDTFNATDVWSNYHSSDDWVYRGGLNHSAWTYLGKLNNLTTNDDQWKLPDGIAASRYVISDTETIVAKLKASVDIFVPEITCEPATLSIHPKVMDDSDDVNIQFASESCSKAVSGIDICGVFRYGVDMGPTDTNSLCEENPRVYSVNRVECPHDTEPRWAISTADFLSSQRSNGNLNPGALKIIRSAAFLCKIGYQIATSNAVLERMSHDVSFPDAVPLTGRRTLSNLSSEAFAKMLWTNLGNPAQEFIVDQRIPTQKPSLDPSMPGPGPADVLFQLLYAYFGYPDTLDAFYRTEVLTNATVSVLEGVATDFARQSLLMPQSTVKPIQGWVNEERLHVRTAILWLLVGGFGLMTLLCTFLIVSVPQFSWIPAMSGSLASNASVLTSSFSLQECLVVLDNLGKNELTKRLEKKMFVAKIGIAGQLKLEAYAASESLLLQITNTKKSGKKRPSAWKPLTSRLPVITLTYALPLITIILLEVLYRMIQKQKILVLIGSNDSATLSYIIRISSTLLIFGVATMINNIDFTVVTFAPFSELRKGNVPAAKSILFHLLSVDPILVLVKSLRHRHFGPAMSNAATLIAGFLTIVVSGIWTSKESLLVNQSTTVLVNDWDRTWLGNTSDDGGSGVVLNLLRHGGASVATDIRGDLVIPQTFVPVITDSSRRSVNYTYDVLALRPWLNCTIVPQQDIVNTHVGIPEDNYDIPSQFNIEFPLNLPGANDGCLVTANNGSQNISFARDVFSSNTSESPISIGQYFDLDMSNNNTSTPAECPSIAMLFGNFMWNTTVARNLTALVCSQGIEQVPITLSYIINSTFQGTTGIQMRGDPINILDATGSPRTPMYKLHEFMERSFLRFPQNTRSIAWYDAFFNHLLLRPGGHGVESLVGLNNVNEFIRVVTEDYEEYLRHVIDRKFRAENQTSVSELFSAVEYNSGQPSSSGSTTKGTYSAQTTHLVIDKTSRIVLQVLLGAMTALSFAGFMLVKIRGTLPRDPCSIGSSMAFLAGSQLCDRESGVIPQGAEYMNETQLRKVFDGWVFSLGWWPHGAASSTIRTISPGHDSTTTMRETDVEESQELSQGLCHSGRTSGSTFRTVAMESNAGKCFGVDVGKADTYH